MGRRVSKAVQRRALYGWIWWAPLFALAFAPLFADAYLNIQMRSEDYELNALKAREGELHDRLERLKSEAAGREELARLNVQAVNLGLLAPNPGQVVVLYHDPMDYMQTASDERILLANRQPEEPVQPEGRAQPETPTPPAVVLETVVSAPALLEATPDFAIADAEITVTAEPARPIVFVDAPAPAGDVWGSSIEEITPNTGTPASLDDSVESMLATL